jgi:hypothetical protein
MTVICPVNDWVFQSNHRLGSIDWPVAAAAVAWGESSIEPL